MMVITKVYNKGKVCNHYECNLVPFEFYKQQNSIEEILWSMGVEDVIFFDIFDSKKGEIVKYVGAEELLKFCDDIDSLLGFIRLEKKLLFMTVDLITWKLLDCIDGIENKGFVINSGEFVQNLHGEKNLIGHKLGTSYDIQYFKSKKDIICTYWITHSLVPLDKNNIFWLIGKAMYSQLSDIYSILYNIDIKNCNVVYFYDINFNAYKLDINKNVIRLMTKIKTLGKDKLCWF